GVADSEGCGAAADAEGLTSLADGDLIERLTGCTSVDRLSSSAAIERDSAGARRERSTIVSPVTADVDVRSGTYVECSGRQCHRAVKCEGSRATADIQRLTRLVYGDPIEGLTCRRAVNRLGCRGAIESDGARSRSKRSTVVCPVASDVMSERASRKSCS